MDPKKYRNKCYGRKSSESLQELTAKVERLSALAYPGATIEMRDILAVDAFIEALDNTALRYKLQEREPSSPRDALVTAMKLESLMQARDIAKDQVRRPLRAAKAEVSSVQTSGQADVSSSGNKADTYRRQKKQASPRHP